MTVAARLRALDDRVLGPARIAGRPDHRTTFAIGVAGSVAVLLTAVLSRRTVLLSGAGGFFGVTIVWGVAWARTHTGPADDRPRCS